MTTTALTIQQQAAILAVTQRRISQLRSEGLPNDPAAFGNWWRDREGATSAKLDAAAEKARVDHHRANLLALEQGEAERRLIPAAEVEAAVGLAFGTISQSLRSIPDDLERRHGLAPEVAEQVELAILAAMDHLADRLATLAPEVAADEP